MARRLLPLRHVWLGKWSRYPERLGGNGAQSALGGDWKRLPVRDNSGCYVEICASRYPAFAIPHAKGTMATCASINGWRHLKGGYRASAKHSVCRKAPGLALLGGASLSAGLSRRASAGARAGAAGGRRGRSTRLRQSNTSGPGNARVSESPLARPIGCARGR